ncbi:hypothetical protein GBAR_LOCUS18057, partial [Geodia barretti]
TKHTVCSTTISCRVYPLNTHHPPAIRHITVVDNYSCTKQVTSVFLYKQEMWTQDHCREGHTVSESSSAVVCNGVHCFN